MERHEWTRFVPYKIDQRSHLTSKAVAQIVEQLPSSFLFIDIDKVMAVKKPDESLEVDAVTDFVKMVETDCKAIPAKALEDLVR